MEHRRLALLIDSENISAKYMSVISEELKKHGVVTYKRIYGDWANTQTAKWREKVSEYALTPVQQFRNIVGKNAIDSALIIDAMDILYTNNVEGFCIASSDSDFTRLVNRLTESGMLVIGMGEEKSTNSFRVACSIFINLQSIEQQKKEQECLELEALKEAEEEIATGMMQESSIKQERKVKKESMISRVKSDKMIKQPIKREMIEQAILDIIIKNENGCKITDLGEVGSRLREKYPNFNVKQYGYSGLAKFLEDMKEITVVKVNTKVGIKIKQECDEMSHISRYVKQLLSQSPSGTMELGTLGRNIHNQYQPFDIKMVGYSKLSTFVKSIEGIEIKKEPGKKNNRQIVYLQK